MIFVMTGINLKNNTPIEVLDYQNDSFYGIYMDYRNVEMFIDKIKQTLNNSLKLSDTKC